MLNEMQTCLQGAGEEVVGVETCTCHSWAETMSRVLTEAAPQTERCVGAASQRK